MSQTATSPEQPSQQMNANNPALQTQQQPQQQQQPNTQAPQQQQPQQQQQQQGGGQMVDANSLAAAMLQQPGAVNTDQQHGLNVANEIKRLQQLQHMGSAAAPGTALIMQGGQRPADASILQSMLDQKVQNSRFENPLAQTMGAGGMNPMLQPAFLQDARLFMAQNQFNAANPNRQPEIPLPSPHSLFHRDGSRRMRGGVIEPFPEKLHRLLLEVEAAGRSDVISFVASGRAFSIHKPDKFFKEIVPLYFRQSRLSSFKRQLNLYGFELINTGPARGGYYHELFVKERPELCRRMRRVAVKVSTKNSTPADPPKEVQVPKKEEEPKGGQQQPQQHGETNNVPVQPAA